MSEKKRLVSDEEIERQWIAFSDDDHGVERAAAMTADVLGCSYGDVFDALQRQHERRIAKP
jgi:hypothetical protein